MTMVEEISLAIIEGRQVLQCVCCSSAGNCLYSRIKKVYTMSLQPFYCGLVRGPHVEK